MRRRDLFCPRPRDDLRQRDEPDVSWVEVIVLGVVQGLTEFLPISSSAHLRIVSGVFFGRTTRARRSPRSPSWAPSRRCSSTSPATSGGSTKAWFRGLFAGRRAPNPDYRMGWFVIIGTIPIGVLGLLFKDQIHTGAAQSVADRDRADRLRAVIGLAERVGPAEASSRCELTSGTASSWAWRRPGADPRGVAVRRDDQRGPVPRAHPARGRPVSFLLAIPAVFASGCSSCPTSSRRGGAERRGSWWWRR